MFNFFVAVKTKQTQTEMSINRAVDNHAVIWLLKEVDTQALAQKDGQDKSANRLKDHVC